MTQDEGAASPGIARRDLMFAGAGAAALAFGIGNDERALAQAAPPPVSPTSGPPGRVVVEKRGAILLIGIDRPQAQNRFDPPILIGLGKAYYQLEHDDSLRVAVLHGIGPNFSLGVDVPAFVAGVKEGILPPKDPDFINAFNLKTPIRTKPVVVAAQGGTKYGAHELFLAADIRVAASDCVFCQGEVTRGIFPGGGATVRFTREAGWGNAMRYMLTSEEWGAEEARRLGLVQEVTPPGKQLERAVALANKIAAAAPLGVRATLASAHQAIGGEDAALQALGPAFQHILQSADAQEAQRAFREGRAPVYQGL
ncbi:MAG TPA: crotonase/enoyl-CoA hydratase family protein [Stellaceae bacterium]|nr:crotonase/enoyl-CoA hydratase family protein [Stellaceae bacterium]